MVALRRVAGSSMVPGYPPDSLVLLRHIRRKRRLKPGEVVIIRHNGLDKMKRLHQIADGRVYVLGDNPDASTDSRHFGWLPIDAVQAKVMWPKRQYRR